ncbi:hypothetical protein ARMGADRAFT_1089571 [Armillaria gallica]|uniref:Uncharacterized protein n=1 Tax=Armillaria gallica TaxID=47427 RepID=A0A2H3CPB1_ARMGA|nr:hypothetical protein ARMGADRAFT_1089571 [Armillaria gallica]
MNRPPAPLSPMGLASRASPHFAPSSLRSEESDSPKQSIPSLRQAFLELHPAQKDEGGLLLKQEMLMSEGEVDEKLRKMKETFLASLEALGRIEGSIRRKKTDSPENRGRESPTELEMKGFVRPRYRSAASQGSEEMMGKVGFGDDRGWGRRWAHAVLVSSSIFTLSSTCSNAYVPVMGGAAGIRTSKALRATGKYSSSDYVIFPPGPARRVYLEPGQDGYSCSWDPAINPWDPCSHF